MYYAGRICFLPSLPPLDPRERGAAAVLTPQDSTSFWMCKVRCWRWLSGNKTPISLHPKSTLAKSTPPMLALHRVLDVPLARCLHPANVQGENRECLRVGLQNPRLPVLACPRQWLQLAQPSYSHTELFSHRDFFSGRFPPVQKWIRSRIALVKGL